VYHYSCSRDGELSIRRFTRQIRTSIPGSIVRNTFASLVFQLSPLGIGTGSSNLRYPGRPNRGIVPGCIIMDAFTSLVFQLSIFPLGICTGASHLRYPGCPDRGRIPGSIIRDTFTPFAFQLLGVSILFLGAGDGAFRTTVGALTRHWTVGIKSLDRCTTAFAHITALGIPLAFVRPIRLLRAISAVSAIGTLAVDSLGASRTECITARTATRIGAISRSVCIWHILLQATTVCRTAP
jgi:hypothetical protein